MLFPVLVVSLARHKDRLQRCFTSLAEMQLDTSAIVVDAIDGNLLKQQGGRARHLGGGKVRMCWNSEQGRQQRTFSMGRSLQKGFSSAWGMMGCALSHELLAPV